MQTSGSMNSIVSSSLPWMQSTGHTSTHDLSFVPMHGSVMMYVMAREGLRGGPGRSYRLKGEKPAARAGVSVGRYGASVCRPAAADRAEDEQEDHRTDERDDDAP